MRPPSYERFLGLRGLAPFLALTGIGAALSCTSLGSLDLPLSLANGRLILNGDGIPAANRWLWTFPGHPYVPDKWLFDLVVAAADRVAGETGLVALQALLGALTGVALLALARRTLPPAPAAGVAALAVTMLSFRFFLRAEWLSFLGVAATLLLLPGLRAARRRSDVAFLALAVAWSASHVYWFLGPGIVLVAGAMERNRRLALVGSIGVLAAAVSPAGFANVAHPARIALQLGGTELGAGIAENRFPFGSDVAWSFFHALAALLAVACAIACVLHARAGNRFEAAILALALPFSLAIERNLAFLGLCVPLAASAPMPPRIVRTLAATGVASIVAAAGLFAGRDSFLAGRTAGLGWPKGRYPEKLVASLGASRERFVNDFSLGSWLDLARGSSFIDGHTHGYPPEFYDFYRRSLTGEVPIEDVDARHPNDGWLLRHDASTTRMWVLGLFVNGAYAPVAWDDVGTLFRRGTPPEETDAAWRRWLADVYLPRARAWFGPTAAGASPRDALAADPWSRAAYEALARDLERRGDPGTAARAWRWAFRLPR